jgi:GDP-L-fucose synthase
MENYDAAELINVGVGEELTIAELAVLMAQVVGYTGRIVFDPSRPDGTPRRLLDLSRIQNLGWHAQIPLERGVLLQPVVPILCASQEVSAEESHD